MPDTTTQDAAKPLPDLLKPRSETEFASLPSLPQRVIQEAVEQGRLARTKAEASVQPGNAAQSRVFYK